MKRILITLLALALVATLFVSCNGDAAASAPDPLETVSVENFLKSYYAADFMKQNIYTISNFAQDATSGSKTIQTPTDDDAIKSNLTNGFTNEANTKKFNVTSVTSAAGTLTMQTQNSTTPATTGTTLPTTGTYTLTETVTVEGCKIAFSYKKNTSTNGTTWVEDSSDTTLYTNGNLECSMKLVEETTGNIENSTPSPDSVCTVKYSNIKSSLEITDGDVTAVSKTSVSSYKDIEYVMEYKNDNWTLNSAKYNGVALSAEDVAKLSPIIIGK